MSAEFTWYPDPKRARREYMLFKKGLMKKASLPEEPDSDRALDPAIAWKAFGRSQKCDYSKASQTEGIRFNAKSHEWVVKSIDEQRQEFLSDTGRDPQLRLGNPFAESSQEKLLEALHWLEILWPEAATQIRFLVHDVVWIQGERFWSSSAPYSFGALYLNPQEHWGVAHFVDTLLHESGHLSLMIKQAFDPLLSNPKERARSPLREDPRPLIGILHATYVLKRITHGLKLYIDSEHAVPDREQARALYEDYLRRIPEGIEVLEKHAKFSDAGYQLLRSLKSPSNRSISKRATSSSFMRA